MKKVFLALVALLTLAAAPALAANCASYPYTLTNGTTADANQVMSNFNSILNCGNNNLAENGANASITSLSGLTTPLSIAQGGTSGSSLSAAQTALAITPVYDNTGAIISGPHMIYGQSTALSSGTSVAISGAALFTSPTTVSCSVMDTAGSSTATTGYTLFTSPQRLRLFDSASGNVVAYICIGT